MCSVHWVHVYFEVIIIHESLDSVNKDNISSNVHMYTVLKSTNLNVLKKTQKTLTVLNF